MAIKEYFPGANTPDGFYSYYSEIFKNDEAESVVILKGGPGTGKSSLMKKTATFAADKGYDVELLHCSSDPASLDGVCVREKGFLILDGTSPHVIDPKFPGAVEEIVNLGCFWRADEIRLYKSEIQKLTAEISNSFKRAYSFMNAAHSVMNQIRKDVRPDKNFVYSEIDATVKELDVKKTIHKGKIRKGFLSADTHLGKISYVSSFARDTERIIRIVPDIGGTWAEYMKEISEYLKRSGDDVRIFYSNMNPGSEIEHIYSEDGSLFITTEKTVENAGMIIDFEKNSTSVYYPEYEDDKKVYNILMQKTTSALKTAKALHDELEKFYIPHMNFDMMDSALELILKKLD